MSWYWIDEVERELSPLSDPEGHVGVAPRRSRVAFEEFLEHPEVLGVARRIAAVITGPASLPKPAGPPALRSVISVPPVGVSCQV